jgi:hypothetical protein
MATDTRSIRAITVRPNNGMHPIADTTALM